MERRERWEWCLSHTFPEHESQGAQSPATPKGYMHLLSSPGEETTPLKLWPTPSTLSLRASSTSSPVTGWVRWRGSRRAPRGTGWRGGGAAKESQRRTRSASEREGARKGDAHRRQLATTSSHHQHCHLPCNSHLASFSAGRDSGPRSR